MKKEKNEELKRKSRLMIGLFSFLGIAMIASIAITSFTGKGTYSADGAKAYVCYFIGEDGQQAGAAWYSDEDVSAGYESVICRRNENVPTPTPSPTPIYCEYIKDDETACKMYSCYYYDGSCHSTPKATQAPTATPNCAPGKYASIDGSCKDCPQGYYCVGGSAGAIRCPNGKTSSGNAKSEDDCYDEYCINANKYKYGANCYSCNAGTHLKSRVNECYGTNSDCCEEDGCQTKDQCETANPGYLCINGGNDCYTKSSNACYKCTKDSKAYYTYTNEGGCPLAESYSKCASDTQGKNRLYLMEHNTSTGATSVVNVLECVQDANEECKVSPGGTWYHEKTCDRLVSPTTNVTINGDTTWWRCVGGGTIPTDPPGDPTNPTNPPSGETKTCYVCVSGEKIQYIKASSSANAAAAASELGTITAANCATTSEANCDGTAVSNCYECNGTKKHVMADSEAAAKARSGGTTCTIVTSDKCNPTPTPDTPSSNPKTGTTGIIIAWIVAMMTVGYAMWYYKKSSSLS